jgi:hypothetical protein
MRYLFRLAGLAIILWLHHPLLARAPTGDKATPLREFDRSEDQDQGEYTRTHPTEFALHTPRSAGGVA